MRRATVYPVLYGHLQGALTGGDERLLWVGRLLMMHVYRYEWML